MAVGGRRVIAGVSGSMRSLGALRAGVEEAREMGAPLTAVLAWEPAGGELAYRRAPCPVLLRLWEHAAVERLTEAFDAALGGVPRDVTVHLMVVRGKAGPFLVDFADQPDDLIVVGCGGRNRLASSLRGSVSRYCMAHAHCPVLAVPPPELISEVRSRPHRWRPEDFAVPLDRPDASGPDASGPDASGPDASGPAAAGPAAGTPRRAATATSERPPSYRAAGLSAYQGAPYRQPSGPTRADRTLHRIRLACILIAAIALVALTGILLAQSLP